MAVHHMTLDPNKSCLTCNNLYLGFCSLMNIKKKPTEIDSCYDWGKTLVNGKVKPKRKRRLL